MDMLMAIDIYSNLELKISSGQIFIGIELLNSSSVKGLESNRSSTVSLKSLLENLVICELTVESSG